LDSGGAPAGGRSSQLAVADVISAVTIDPDDARAGIFMESETAGDATRMARLLTESEGPSLLEKRESDALP
jgi:hypothetical protein